MAGLAHLGVGFALKRAAPGLPVIALLVAAEGLDLLMLPLLAAPSGADTLALTHGLFMAGLWSLSACALAAILRLGARSGLVLGFAVLSHWLLDFITHPMGAIFGGKPLPPDLPLLFAGSPRVGLGLYNRSYALSLAFDLAVTLAGIAVYVAYRRRGASGRSGHRRGRGVDAAGGEGLPGRLP